jgi:ribosomal protein uS3
LTIVIQKRFNFLLGFIELQIEQAGNRNLCAVVQAESLRNNLEKGFMVRRAAYFVLQKVMESGAKGCEVIVSGKLQAQRAKTMKFKDGYMISTGQPAREFRDEATRHVKLSKGVLGVRVRITKAYDSSGKNGPNKPMPDFVNIQQPKIE